MRRLRLAFAAASAALVTLTGCNDVDVAPDRLPRFEPPVGPPPKVALVLGSGGPRGFAHIGVIKALEANGVRPDLIVGSSVGAMVGVFYAAGMDPAALERLALDLQPLTFVLELRVIGGGAASGAAVQAYINRQLGHRPVEALPLRFAAAATRMHDRKLVLFNRGDPGLAVRASGASPGDFEPVRIGAETYFDGDEASPVPIRAARELGARVVIAVDVSAFLADTPPDAPQEWIDKDARRTRQVAEEAPAADVLLHPDIGYHPGYREAYRRKVIEIAERHTLERMPEILAALARAGLAPQKAETALSPAGDASR